MSSPAVAVGATVLVVGMAGWAYAAIPTTGATIRACVANANDFRSTVRHDVGSVRFVVRCRPDETAVTLNRRGPAGAKGDTGASGLQGTKGEPGSTGAQGPTGARGPTGERGLTGEQGPGLRTYAATLGTSNGAITVSATGDLQPGMLEYVGTGVYRANFSNTGGCVFAVVSPQRDFTVAALTAVTCNTFLIVTRDIRDRLLVDSPVSLQVTAPTGGA
jgi:hypothetical protein